MKPRRFALLSRMKPSAICEAIAGQLPPIQFATPLSFA